MISSSKLVISCILTNVVTIALFFASLSIENCNFWADLYGNYKIIERFCEAKHTDSFLIEPMNSVSNLLFVIYGEIIYYIFLYDVFFVTSNRNEYDNYLLKYPIWSLMYSILLIFIGISSFMYHASKNPIARQCDNYSMLTMVIWCYCYLFLNILSIFCRNNRMNNYMYFINAIFLFIFFCLISILYFFYIHFIENGFGMKSVMKISIGSISIIFILLSICRKFKNLTKLLLMNAMIAMLSTFLSYFLRLNDGKYCDKHSWFQLHAMFHIICAVGLGSLYFMWRYEIIHTI